MNNASDLSDELKARKETQAWDLKDCPCCRAKPKVHQREDSVLIICSQWGCTEAEGKTMSDAAHIWNQPRFTDP